MAFVDRLFRVRKEEENPLEYPEVTFLKTRIKELSSDVDFYRTKASLLSSGPIENSERKELEEKINSLKERIVTLKTENAYLRGFIDGDPNSRVTMEKNFFGGE